MKTTSSQDRAVAGKAIRRALAVVTGVLVTALITASPASADDTSFLNEMGYNNMGDSSALRWGHGVCVDLQSGVSVQAIYQNVAKVTRVNRTGGFMGSAVRNLCPDQMPKLQAGMG